MTTETKITPGDTVTIKSGGPKMTVESLRGVTVHCIYYSGQHHEIRKIAIEACALSISKASE